jgi:ubiquitin carboxyl-terminal hydrolase 8
MYCYKGKYYANKNEYIDAIRNDIQPNNRQHQPITINESLNDDKIVEERKKLYVRGLSGLNNIGNTCYMNSILQCLSAINVFRCWLTENKYNTRLYFNMMTDIANQKRKRENIPDNIVVKVQNQEITDKCNNTVVNSLSELFKIMWKQNTSITPRTFKSIIGEICPLFRGSAQNDSQELLNMIIDRIHEETKSDSLKVTFPHIAENVANYLKVKTECTEKANDDTTPIEDKEKYLSYLKDYTKEHINDSIIGEAYLYWGKYVKRSHSIVTDLFTGLYCSKITCHECNSVTCSFEPFTILSLETKPDGETTLEESLDSFVKEELLTDENKYSCSECKKKVDATKRMQIWSPPNILIIQLKRFKNENIYGNMYRPVKTSSKVIFPIENMDIKNYTSDIFPVNNTTYDLISISEHRGTCDFGHYVAYSKNSINDEWYEFNDNDVFRVPKNELEKELITKNAYLLFYVRKIN